MTAGLPKDYGGLFRRLKSGQAFLFMVSQKTIAKSQGFMSPDFRLLIGKRKVDYVE